LKVGRKRLQVESHDCYYWSGRGLPQNLQLLAPETQISFACPSGRAGGAG
jgi:hypothetical protein